MVKVRFISNIFKPKEAKEEFTFENCDSIRGYLKEIFGEDFLEFDSPTVCFINKQAIIRSAWDEICKEGDLIEFVEIPGGYFTAGLGAIADFFAFFGAFTTGQAAFIPGALTNIGLTLGTIGGGLVLANNLDLTPDINDPSAGIPETYSLRGANRLARPNEPIEVNYGKPILFPKYAARPYTSYLNDEQYLTQLMMIGVGDYDTANAVIKIGDTPINDFQSVTKRFFKGTAAPEIYPMYGVETSSEISNLRLYAPNESSFPVGGWSGPWVMNKTGTKADRLQIDFVFPGGLYSLTSTNKRIASEIQPVYFQLQIQKVDNSGNAVGNWATLVSTTNRPVAGSNDESVTNNPSSGNSLRIGRAQVEPVRVTEEFNIEPTYGRYRMRIKRVTNRKMDGNTPDSDHVTDVFLEKARTIYAKPDSVTNLGDVTLLEMRIKATQNINSQHPHQVSVEVNRKLSTYNKTTGVWSAPAVTRSWVWAFCDMAKNVGGLSDSDLNLNTLTDFSTDDINFDYSFTRGTVLWTALKTIATVARAAPVMHANDSRITVIKDVAPNPLIPTAIFNKENINKDSLEWGIITAKDTDYDGVKVEYFDATTRKQETVLCLLDNESGDNPERVILRGVTDRQKAFEFGCYTRAKKKYLKDSFSFKTTREGLIPKIGDLIAFNHPTPKLEGTVDGIIKSITAKTISSYTYGSWPSNRVSASGSSLNLNTIPEGLAYGDSNSTNRPSGVNNFVVYTYPNGAQIVCWGRQNANLRYRASQTDSWGGADTVPSNLIATDANTGSITTAKLIRMNSANTPQALSNDPDMTSWAIIYEPTSGTQRVAQRFAGWGYWDRTKTLGEGLSTTDFILELSDKVTFDPSVTEYKMAIRSDTAGLVGPMVITEGSDDYHVNVAGQSNLNTRITIEANKLNPWFTFGPSTAWTRFTKLVKISPDQHGSVTLDLEPYDARVHNPNWGTAPAIGETPTGIIIERPEVGEVWVEPFKDNPNVPVIKWSEADGAVKYKATIESTDSDAVGETVIGETDNLWLIYPTLPRQNVKIRVYGIGDSGLEGPPGVWTGNIGRFSNPDVLSGLYVSAIPLGLKIGWTRSTDEFPYRTVIELSSSSNFSSPTEHTVAWDAGPVLIFDLEPETAYYVRVKPLDSFGNLGSTWHALNSAVKPGSDDVVGNVTPPSYNWFGIGNNWTPSTAQKFLKVEFTDRGVVVARGYVLIDRSTKFISLNPFGGNYWVTGLAGMTDSLNLSRMTITHEQEPGLIALTFKYSYHNVIRYAHAQITITHQETPLAGKPSKSGTPSLISPTNNSLEVSTIPGNTGGTPTSYLWQASKSSDFSSPIEVTSYKNSALIPGLEASTTYYVRVKPSNLYGAADDWSGTLTTATSASAKAPETPDKPWVDSFVPGTSITLRTEPNEGGSPTTYRWRISEDSTVNDSDTKTTTTTPTITISRTNREFWVDVQARNATGDSSYSDDLDVLNDPFWLNPIKGKLPKPTITKNKAKAAVIFINVSYLQTSAAIATRVELGWNKKTGTDEGDEEFNFHDITVGVNGNKTVVVQTDEDLDASTAYILHARLWNEHGPGDWSTSLEVTTGSNWGNLASETLPREFNLNTAQPGLKNVGFNSSNKPTNSSPYGYFLTGVVYTLTTYQQLALCNFSPASSYNNFITEVFYRATRTSSWLRGYSNIPSEYRLADLDNHSLAPLARIVKLSGNDAVSDVPYSVSALYDSNYTAYGFSFIDTANSLQYLYGPFYDTHGLLGVTSRTAP